MADDDGEIEYLDEDEDLVQQYVSTGQNDSQNETQDAVVPVSDFVPQDPLLVERKRAEKRRYKMEDDDDDYSPSEEDPSDEERKKKRAAERKRRRLNAMKRKISFVDKTMPKEVLNFPKSGLRATPESRQTVKTSKTTPKEVLNIKTVNRVTPDGRKTNQTVKSFESKLKSLPNLTVKKTFKVKYDSKSDQLISPQLPKKVVKTSAELLKERKALEIRIPDYSDALCISAQAIITNESDGRRLKQWNNICLQQYKKNLLDIEGPEIVSTTKTVVFRNTKRNTGKVETTIWSKIVQTLQSGRKKSEMLETILPKFLTRNTVHKYNLLPNLPKFSQPRRRKVFQALLTKEDWKGEESLVVYKPEAALSAVYRFLNDEESDKLQLNSNESAARVLKEVACCKACAACYQTSWRGLRKNGKSVDRVSCAICKRIFLSVSSLLNHLKLNHEPSDVRAHREALSKTVASMVDYHYKCRICQQQFSTIKEQRKHVQNEHKGQDIFTCEIGNHMAS